MRIAIVTSGYAPDIGGVERHAERLSEGLVGRGNTVDVYTQVRGDERRMTETRNGVTVHRFRTRGPGTALRVAPELANRLRREAGTFDVVHAHNYHALPALWAAASGPTRLVFTPHYHGRGHSSFLDALHKPYDLLGHRIFRRSHRVIAVSDAEKRLLLQDIPEIASRLQIIPNGTDVLREFSPFPATGPVALCVGRLEDHKQVHKVIAAVLALPTEWTLTVVGDGPMRTTLQRLVDEAALSERVKLVGRVTDQDLASWYHTATVTVTMSAAEAYGMVLAEALSVRGRVVASDIASHREIIEQSGAANAVLVPATATPKQIAAAIERAAQEPQSGGATLPSWDEVVDATARLYEESLAG